MRCLALHRCGWAHASAGQPAVQKGDVARKIVRFLQPALVGALLAGLLSWGSSRWARAADCPIVLHDVTAQSGIMFRHTDGSGGQRYIVETVASGLATFDYDGDGWIDVYFLNGRPLRGSPPDPKARNALYRNLGGLKFVEVTDQAGVGEAGYGLGVCVGDYDNDGWPDLYINNYGPNVLYRNRGDGTFADATSEAGVGRGHKVGAGACFLDMDADGDLDLYAANYVHFTYENHVARTVDGFPQYAGPKDYPPEPDNLFRNNGDGTFADVTGPSGIGAVAGTGMGMVAADYDNDGDTDIFVLNDVSRNFFFRNDGRGHFTEDGIGLGVAFNFHGHELGSMGVDCGDYDNDGWLDFLQTSYQAELPVLFRNRGDGSFDDVTVETGAGAGSFPYVKWGVGFVDFDNDGFRDLFIACGHLQDNIELWDDTTSYLCRPVLLRNTGEGKFVNVSDYAGDGMRVKVVGRGAVFDDLDNDGDIDVVILSSRRPPVVLRNDSHTGNHWLQIELRGRRTNRDGVGAHVRVVAGPLTQLAEVHSGRSYQSHFGSRLHFGLGRHARAERIEVRWLGGATQVLRDVPADQRIVIFESSSGTQDAMPGASGQSGWMAVR